MYQPTNIEQLARIRIIIYIFKSLGLISKYNYLCLNILRYLHKHKCNHFDCFKKNLSFRNTNIHFYLGIIYYIFTLNMLKLFMRCLFHYFSLC